ncbi:DUF853 family protein [Erysipelothrix sp. HDW6C]|uniref:helicase HerA-like domain-containing protein n=1 Tax=Erysipelothrix sp. HDW6C TaxID=2714930 RepID=UPI00140DD54C|nr:helicase HerA-like domain-containing protein [Erysipelothrix sp. HDW6C]QIK69862.1 DUF853 family protein [Erysipelothrix sp. HDW6C]
MIKDGKIWIAQNDDSVYLFPKQLNRHGLITGATGTGKTVTLKVLVEALSELGVPTFLADIKGDVSGLAAIGVSNENVDKRVEKFAINDFSHKAFPVVFWDIFGESGIPIRTTISDMGPIMLSKLLELNETQASILTLLFKIADEQGLLLLDFKDLKAALDFVSKNAKELESQYGYMSSQSIGAVIRKLIYLEEQGADIFFGEPALDIFDWIAHDSSGKGIINILHAVKLFHTPVLYATFLLWMLSELFEMLPEVGDLEKPKIVFFFDEAHLLFKDMPKSLIDRIELVVKLIRSKGVGVFFITQNPADIPDIVLSQLGNRVQHALRAYTPGEQKQVKAAANAFRVNPAFDTATVITELATGEALVSSLDENGIPTVVERAFILPPQSFMGEIDSAHRTQLIAMSPLNAKYREAIDRESAFELLSAKQLEAEEMAQQAEKQAQVAKQLADEAKENEKAKRQAKQSQKNNPLTKGFNSAVTSMGREIGRSIVRGILGTFGGKKR